VEIIRELISKPPDHLETPIFRFERTTKAANHNAALFKNYKFDLDTVLSSHPRSQISYGSECRSSSDLQELLQDHPHWSALKIILDNGATFPLTEMSEEDRIRTYISIFNEEIINLQKNMWKP
jgi:hypothetical protein